MNLIEGTRRLSLSVGLVGAVVMTMLEPINLTAIHNGYLRRQRFDALMKLPAMERIAVEISNRPPKPANVRRKNLADAIRTSCGLSTDDAAEFEQLLSEATTSEYIDEWLNTDRSKPQVIPIHRYGIATIEVGYTGEITAIDTTDGQRGDIVSENWYSESIDHLASPLWGFLVPWGLIRGIAWVLNGFRQVPRG